MDNEKERYIKTNDDLNYLISRIKKGPPFAEAFTFSCEKFKKQIFSILGISLKEFKIKYFFYNEKENLHISESERGFIWISTMGLVANKDSISTNNNYVNSCRSQYITVSLLIERVINLCNSEDIYDVDSGVYECLNEIFPALFHNLVFYFELFGKAYLSINKISIPKTHKLSEIFLKVKESMFTLKHNDTLFHAFVIPMFENIVNHINTIPGNFKEQFIKYDDNTSDTTVMSLNLNGLINMRNSIDLSNDFIFQYCFNKDGVFYLHQNLYNRFLENVKNDDEKQRVKSLYNFLKETN